ncbi:MAG: hypothetical protein ACREAE_08440, partial [Nitrosopumilaceae archaeon]
LLRVSSAFPCGLLLYLGHYWRNIIGELLSSLPSGMAPFGPEIIFQMVVSGFAFIVALLVNIYVAEKMIIGNQISDKDKIKSYDELVGTALAVTFFLALGGMEIVEAVLLLATFMSLLKIVVSSRSKETHLFNAISTGERIFWSILTKKRNRTRTFFFSASFALSAVIILVNLGFTDYQSSYQLLFMAISFSAAFLGFYGTKKEWTKASYMILAIIPYVGAFLLVMNYPQAMPFNSFLYDSLSQSGIAFSDSILYALPTIVFILVFTQLIGLVPSIASEESWSGKSRSLIYGYVGDVIPFAGFGMIFELFFLESISAGWFPQNIMLGEQRLGGAFPAEGKTIILMVGWIVLALGAIFLATGKYADLKSSRKTLAIAEKIKTSILLFFVFLAFSIGSSLSDSYLVSNTATDDYLAGKITVEKDSPYNSIPIMDAESRIKITARTLSDDVVKASVFDEWDYMHKEFEITSKESAIVINDLDRMNYEITFKVLQDSDGDGKSDIMIDVDRVNKEKYLGFLALAGLWNFILLIPYIRTVINI